MDSSRTAPSLIKRRFFFPPPSLCPCRRREEHIFLVDQPFCSSFPLRPRLCLFPSLSFSALHVIIIALKMKITISCVFLMCIKIHISVHSLHIISLVLFLYQFNICEHWLSRSLFLLSSFVIFLLPSLSRSSSPSFDAKSCERCSLHGQGFTKQTHWRKEKERNK